MYEAGQGADGQGSFAQAGLGNAIGSQLLALLMGEDIVPGESPGYQLCKVIYSYHPLGAILAEAPITRAQSQERIISIAMMGEDRIISRFRQVWGTIGKVGATEIIKNLMRVSRIYGIASIGVGERGKDPSKPLDLSRVADADLYFNVFDPLNTAGSLVLNQDPNSPDFLKQSAITVSGQAWHPSRTLAMLNEQPLFIDWTPSAFGFVGRSVYQRALYPLKSFIQSMITDDMITKKAGLLIAKMEQPTSFIDNVVGRMFGAKRGAIKSGVTGQVASIGVTESIEAINLQNMEPVVRLARENIVKNIASSASMPASIIAQETLTAGFGEGQEDAKKEAAYLSHIRETMQPAYTFMDRIVMRKAWNEEFYAALGKDYQEYRKMPYETWLHMLMREFNATWPNPLIEPESEKSKTADVQMKAVVAILETLGPDLDPENKAKLIEWAADNANEREELFASRLDIDPEALRKFLEDKKDQADQAAQQGQAMGAEPKEPPAFSGRT